MSFSELSSSIISQAISMAPAVDHGALRDKQREQMFTRLPDPNALVGKAILNFSVIDRITLPEGWCESRYKVSASGQRVFREYGSVHNSDICMSFVMAERPLEVQARLLLLQILQLASPPETWIQSLAQAQYFGAIENPREFLLFSARSADINGRRSLIIEGCHARPARNVYAVLADTDSGGRLPMAICYQSPKEEYLEYLRDVMISLNSIVWK
jgi:hypothetical protein